MKLLLRLVGNAIALYVASTMIDGIEFGAGGEVDLGSLLAVTLIFGVVNAVIKPFVKLRPARPFWSRSACSLL